MTDETEKKRQAAYIMIGRVLETHDTRHFFRKEILEYERRKESAAEDLRAFGMYDDCGESYREAGAAADAALRDSIDRKVRAEKHFRSRRLDFVERYPELAATLDAMLLEQSQRHASESQAERAEQAAKIEQLAAVRR